jgi:hypothetical protein
LLTRAREIFGGKEFRPDADRGKLALPFIEFLDRNRSDGIGIGFRMAQTVGRLGSVDMSKALLVDFQERRVAAARAEATYGSA